MIEGQGKDTYSHDQRVRVTQTQKTQSQSVVENDTSVPQLTDLQSLQIETATVNRH